MCCLKTYNMKDIQRNKNWNTLNMLRYFSYKHRDGLVQYILALNCSDVRYGGQVGIFFVKTMKY